MFSTIFKSSCLSSLLNFFKQFVMYLAQILEYPGSIEFTKAILPIILSFLIKLSFLIP